MYSTNTLTLNPFATKEKESRHKIPLYSDKVRAGFPSPAEDSVAQRLDINDLLIQNPNSTFFLKVAGDSMVNAGIFEDNILVVDKSVTPSSGDIVIASVNGDFTVKRLLVNRQGGLNAPRYYLIPENKKYKPIPITRYTDFEIWGVVKANISQL
jgi:DNA polymerase V